MCEATNPFILDDYIITTVTKDATFQGDNTTTQARLLRSDFYHLLSVDRVSNLINTEQYKKKMLKSSENIESVSFSFGRRDERTRGFFFIIDIN